MATRVAHELGLPPGHVAYQVESRAAPTTHVEGGVVLSVSLSHAHTHTHTYTHTHARVCVRAVLATDASGGQIRHAGTATRATSVLFLTDGVLLRAAATDLLLRRYSAVILDEAHERTLATDLLLGLLSRAAPLRARLAAQGTVVDADGRPLKVGCAGPHGPVHGTPYTHRR
jgi:hypothetical protein